MWSSIAEGGGPDHRERASVKSILAEALHAVVVGGPLWLAAGEADAGGIDYRAEAMRYAFEPCIAVSAWHSGLEARLGAAEAARMLRERKSAEFARAADRIVARVRGKPCGRDIVRRGARSFPSPWMGSALRSSTSPGARTSTGTRRGSAYPRQHRRNRFPECHSSPAEPDRRRLGLWPENTRGARPVSFPERNGNPRPTRPLGLHEPPIMRVRRTKQAR